MTATRGYHLFDTAFGLVGIAWSDTGIMRLQLPERDAAATETRLKRRLPDATAVAPDAAVAAWIARLRSYFAGQETDLRDLPVDLADVPDFHLQLYAAMRRLAWGETTTYGALASEVGAPGGARAVGQAMGRNPVPVIIPCHRVLASGRKIGGFSAPGGTATKERLLTLERASYEGDAPLLALLGRH